MAAVLLTMVNAAAGGWMGPGRPSMTAVRVPLGWSTRRRRRRTHTRCPAAASGPLALPLHCAHQLAASRTRLGWVGGRECIGAAGGVALPVGGVTNNQKQKKKRRGTTAPQPPPQDRSPLPGHPSRAVPPYVYIYPWCQGAHPGTGSRPGPLAPAGGDPPPPQASRTIPKAQQIECTACCTWCMSWASVRDLALLAAAPARDLSPSVCPMRCAFFVLFTTM